CPTCHPCGSPKVCVLVRIMEKERLCRMNYSYRLRSWCMAATGSATPKATRCLFPTFCLEQRFGRKIVPRKKKRVWTSPLEILKAGAVRAKPVCPHFGTCGGCHYQHAVYE